jgi:hypothetical protein
VTRVTHQQLKLTEIKLSYQHQHQYLGPSCPIKQSQQHDLTMKHTSKMSITKVKSVIPAVYTERQ